MSDPLVAELVRVPTRRAVRGVLRRHATLRDPATVDRLHDIVLRLGLTDVDQAARMARTARHVAELLADDGARAQSHRAVGHVLYARGRYQDAIEEYEKALAVFRRLGREMDVARTLLGALQTFVFLGDYGRAFAAAKEARAIFERHGDRLRLARLDSNVGNVLSRQNRFEAALAHYQAAYQELLVRGEPRDVAAILNNIAVCHINLNDFEQALETYHRTRAYSQQQNLPLAGLYADYNIAYLHYLRGEYAKALDLYRAVASRCEAVGDTYLGALCDLDRSELYLELNLTDDGGELAARALAAFDRLGITYEAAKAMTNVALAAGHNGDTQTAVELFDRAHELFGSEGNAVRQALVDLYRAIVLHRQGQAAQSARRCRRASATFVRAGLGSKAAVCELLLARLALERGARQRAFAHASAALDLLRKADTPALLHQAHFVLGLIGEAEGDTRRALAQFERAHGTLEQLRSHVPGEDLKVAFLKDKSAIYEALVSIRVARARGPAHLEAAFSYIEQAKSRSLADLIAFRATALAPRTQPEAGEELTRIRQELNWYSHRIAQDELRPERRSAQRLAMLRKRTRALETRLLRTVRALRQRDEEFAALQSGGTSSLEDIQASLGSRSVLLEYYRARGRMYVAVLDGAALDIVPLGPAPRVRHLVRLLHFQLSKLAFGSTAASGSADALLAATEAHLYDLHRELIAPVRARLNRRHLVIVPHDFLHQLPFHALFDGDRFLIDDFTVSYAPSASVHHLCAIKPPAVHGGSLLLGVPDESAPYITEEIHEVAAAVPHANVFTGADATHDRLREFGPTSRLIHIATHGMFRRDNPMFSSIRLGSGPLNLFDLYDLNLSADLVTLSGCSTGVNAVIGGDEIVGLVRGLLYSGARSVLLTLWDTHDRSSALFMKGFYSALRDSGDQAEAFQRATRQLRGEYPHPFYWAPFALTGGGSIFPDGVVHPI